jgi:hypothetical protein
MVCDRRVANGNGPWSGNLTCRGGRFGIAIVASGTSVKTLCVIRSGTAIRGPVPGSPRVYVGSYLSGRLQATGKKGRSLFSG